MYFTYCGYSGNLERISSMARSYTEKELKSGMISMFILGWLFGMAFIAALVVFR
jgi:hypothetical protein